MQTIAREAGRDLEQVTGAVYLTLALDDDAERADARVNAYLEQYYGQPAEVLRRRQACYGGPAAGVAAWLQGYADAGASHLVLRFAGDHEKTLEALAEVRQGLGW
ncbi:MAG: hypothetical protein QF893_09665 [Alphaproteobacteria bacterium]|nr:hypothetical protein [Alphaproteobacteria bacterium]